ncbi:MAG TPA: tetratricopeptide repeat protein [Acidobacteriota bacterium]|nr:tetratricopeptide repeat protein [Acidobacteriota bacterium]
MIRYFCMVSPLVAALLMGNGLAQGPTILTLSGKVLMEDGEPPDHEVKVELLCNSRVIRVARTRHEGSFHFRLGEERRPTEVSASSAGPDTLETQRRGIGGLGAGGRLRPAGDGRYDLTNCEIRISPHPGWQADKIGLGIVSIFEPDVGVITVREVSPKAGTLVSASTLAAPPQAAKAYQRAQKELARDKPGRAADKLEEAVDLYPGYAEAWKLLGDTRLRLEDREGSAEAYRKAVEADPNYLPPYMTLAEMELEEVRYEEALRYTSKLIELDPHDSKAHYYHGLAAYSTGALEEAMASFKVIEENGEMDRYPASALMAGDILARSGEAAASAVYLRRYLEMGDVSPEMREQIRRQLEDWESKGLIDRQP